MGYRGLYLEFAGLKIKAPSVGFPDPSPMEGGMPRSQAVMSLGLLPWRSDKSLFFGGGVAAASLADLALLLLSTGLSSL